jgi:hypothetical protein
MSRYVYLVDIDHYKHSHIRCEVYVVGKTFAKLTSITAWGDARCREMLLCSHLLLYSISLKLDVAPVLTSSPAVLLAYKRFA